MPPRAPSPQGAVSRGAVERVMRRLERGGSGREQGVTHLLQTRVLCNVWASVRCTGATGAAPAAIGKPARPQGGASPRRRPLLEMTPDAAGRFERCCSIRCKADPQKPRHQWHSPPCCQLSRTAILTLFHPSDLFKEREFQSLCSTNSFGAGGSPSRAVPSVRCPAWSLVHARRSTPRRAWRRGALGRHRQGRKGPRPAAACGYQRRSWPRKQPSCSLAHTAVRARWHGVRSMLMTEGCSLRRRLCSFHTSKTPMQLERQAEHDHRRRKQAAAATHTSMAMLATHTVKYLQQYFSNLPIV
eukprot:359446-Chlamydomonas_euryale.AAC.7